MKYIPIFVVIFATWSVSANYIGVENNFRYIGSIQTDDKGETNFLEFSPGVTFSTSIPAPILTNTWMFPGVAIFFPNRSDDELYTKWVSEINFHLLTPITDRLDFIYGTTYLMNLIIGAGGTSVQNNGNSTSTYYVPEENRFIGGFVPEIGMRLEFLRAKYIYLGVLAHKLTTKESRSFTVSINLMTWI